MEPVVALLTFFVGIGMTTWGAVSHTAPLVAPGSILALLGSGWLGNALARRDVRLFPTASRSDDEPPADSAGKQDKH